MLWLQVIELCEKKRTPQPKYIVADTPGQIEIFTWSASGAIITEAFASTFPTIVAFVIDTPRSVSPQTFMTNMLQVRESAPGTGTQAMTPLGMHACHLAKEPMSRKALKVDKVAGMPRGLHLTVGMEDKQPSIGCLW